MASCNFFRWCLELALFVVSVVRSPIYALVAHCEVGMITSIAVVKADRKVCVHHVMILISRCCHTVVYSPVVRHCCMSWKYNLRMAVTGSGMQSSWAWSKGSKNSMWRSLPFFWQFGFDGRSYVYALSTRRSLGTLLFAQRYQWNCSSPVDRQPANQNVEENLFFSVQEANMVELVDIGRVVFLGDEEPSCPPQLCWYWLSSTSTRTAVHLVCSCKACRRLHWAQGRIRFLSDVLLLPLCYISEDWCLLVLRRD